MAWKIESQIFEEKEIFRIHHVKVLKYFQKDFGCAQSYDALLYAVDFQLNEVSIFKFYKDFHAFEELVELQSKFMFISQSDNSGLDQPLQSVTLKNRGPILKVQMKRRRRNCDFNFI